MKDSIEKKREFRIGQSQEKLALSMVMLDKCDYNDSLIFSYLSMFYSVRVLLIDKNVDSDDHEKILELVKEYYEPAGWTDIDIVDILNEAKLYKDKLEKDKGIKISKEKADKFYECASLMYKKVQKITDLSKISK